MYNLFDIAVIGAGPAGSAAAKEAASFGAKVCLLERNPIPGTPVRCGEGIGMKTLVNHSEARKEWIKATITHSIMVAPDGSRVTISDIDHSVVLDREKMDADCAHDAIKSGATLYVNTPIISVERRDDDLYRCISPEHEYYARILIIADGVESRIARELGWNTALSKEDIQSCAFTRVYSSLIKPDTCEFHVGSSVTPGGYAWIFYRGKDEANVGLGVLGKHCQGGFAKKALKKFIDTQFPEAKTDTFHCGGVPVTGYVKQLVKDGTLLIGDAARQVNCISGAGIGYALFAGKIAGQIAAESIHDQKVDFKHLLQYERIWKNSYGKQQLRSLALKNFVIQNADDAFLNRIAHSLLKKKNGKMTYLKVFVSTFSRHPLLLFKVFKLFK